MKNWDDDFDIVKANRNIILIFLFIIDKYSHRQMDAKFAVSRLVTELPMHSPRKVLRAMHDCPHCQCFREVVDPLPSYCSSMHFQNPQIISQPMRLNSRSLNNVVTVRNSHSSLDRVTTFKSISPARPKITVRYQSPPRNIYSIPTSYLASPHPYYTNSPYVEQIRRPIL